MTIPPNPHPEQVEITQEDREAAANAVISYRGHRDNNWQQRIRDGKCDDGGMVQAFARHRLASLANRPADDGERLRAVIKLALQCTPVLRCDDLNNCEIDYDCGDPWEILREAVAPPQPEGEKRP